MEGNKRRFHLHPRGGGYLDNPPASISRDKISTLKSDNRRVSATSCVLSSRDCRDVGSDA